MNTLVGANLSIGLAAEIHTCYGPIADEICPNKYKFLGIVFVVVPNVIPPGFGAYLAQMLVHYQSRRYFHYIFLAMLGLSVILQTVFYRFPSFRQLRGNDRARCKKSGGLNSVALSCSKLDCACSYLASPGEVNLSPGLRHVFSALSSQASSFSSYFHSRVNHLTLNQYPVELTAAEIYSVLPNPLVPLHFFLDVRGFVCLIIIASVAAIYGAQATSWQSDAWLSTIIAFGIYGGVVLVSPFVSIIKHVRIRLIILMSISVAFLGAMASVDSRNFGRSAAFSFIATFPSGILELIPVLMVQMDSNDADVGTVFPIIFYFRRALRAIMAAIFVAILGV